MGQCRILSVADPLLQALIIAAVRTGCRRDELLGLRWIEVRVDENDDYRSFVVRAENCKTSRSRTIPVGSDL